MRQLIYVITFTGRFDEMRRFYQHGLGLPLRHAERDWVEFDTAGASLALHRMSDPKRQGMMLRFATPDLDAALDELRGRGLEPDGPAIETPAGRLAPFLDPDGNPLTLLQPATPVPSGAGSPIQTVIVHVADMVAATGFYRDRFGLIAQIQFPWWTQFDTGATQFALHPRVAPTDQLRHHAQRVVVGFEVPDLDALARDLSTRKLRFSGGPVEQRFGSFAEVTDPDGYVVLFRRSEPREPLSPDGVEALEDESPRRGKMRPPRKKTAHSASRVAVKPEYHAKKRAARESKRQPRPTKKRPKSAKPGAASGRLHKSERRSAERKRTGEAAVSRSKPVKRAAARRGGRGRA